MFKKIVSHLPFSPTLVSELGFYAKRLSKEEATRRLGLVLTAIALVVQSFVVFSPPESANAANPSDLVHGGVHTKAQLIAAWDNNTQGFRELLQHAGLSRSSVVNAREGEINTRTKGKDNGWLSWGRVSRGGSAYNETVMKVGEQTIYVRSLAALDSARNRSGGGSYYPSFLMTNSSGDTVAVIKGCANIAMKKRPTSDRNIKVCNLSDRKTITIRESEFNSSRHSKSLADCEDKPIQVCDLNSRTVITINERSFDSSKHSKNLDDCKPRPIQVCELANKKGITIDERDFDAKKHSKNLEDCKEKSVPVASCSSLTLKKLSRTEFELHSSANVANGAKINSYTYVVKDSKGKEVFRRTVNSTSTTNSTKLKLANDGTYSASVTVSTSLGNKTSTACQTQISVKPIERCPLNPELPINDPNCQPCPGDPTLWVKDENCVAKIIRQKAAKNLTTDAPAQNNPAKASERIEFNLTAKNEGKDEATFEFEDDLSDVLEYSSIYDRGGGTLNEETKVLSWGKVTLKPGEEQKRTYVIQMASSISTMSRGTSDPSSYDCKMVNVFGNTIEIEVDCPAPKVIENIVPELPKTGPGENMIAGGVVAAIVTFLYLRSRQLNKEVRLIRREVTAGTI